MSLTDVMSHAGLSHYAVAALVLFLLAFAAILWRTFAPGRRAEMDHDRLLPFDDETRESPTQGAPR
jgi:cbb3-type cytochrome oxidase subunit 3